MDHSKAKASKSIYEGWDEKDDPFAVYLAFLFITEYNFFTVAITAHQHLRQRRLPLRLTKKIAKKQIFGRPLKKLIL